MEYNVLIIDDEPWSRQVVMSLVEWKELNLNLLGEAEDPQNALTMIKQVNPHIIITDMSMPGMTGSEFLKKLEEQFIDLQIIVISGYDDFSYLQQAVRSGAIDYLLKPVDPEELNKTLKKCIDIINEKNRSSTNLMIFNDPDVLDKYIGHRKRVFGYLLELDISMVKNSLNKMFDYFKNTLGLTIDNEVGARLQHDFIIILEEFTTRFGLDIRSMKTLFEKIEQRGEKDRLKSLLDIFADTIIAVEDFQRAKGYLNLEDVKNHIDHYYQEVLSLDTVAKLFLVSKEHMSRCFKKEYNIAINEYITKLRMIKARDLIINDGVEIKQVAFLCGYTDLAYFYRVFKKYFGIPPGKMRN